MIRLLLVDDQSLVCQGLAAMLSLEEDLEILGTANNGQAAIELVAKQQPDVVLMDVRMPVMDGREATRTIVQQFPEVKVLVLSFSSSSPALYPLRISGRMRVSRGVVSDRFGKANRSDINDETNKPLLFRRILIFDVLTKS